MKTENKLIGTGVVTAIAASLCCIAPILTLVTGATGFASAFPWLEPARPYFIALTVLLLGFAWYLKIMPKKQINCNCGTDEKPKFIQSRLFLGIVTLFTGLMLFFPSYAPFFYRENTQHGIATDHTGNIKTIEFRITGMTCESCVYHVNQEVNKLTGIIRSDTSYDKGNAVIAFDGSKTTAARIEQAINSTGYTVTRIKEK